MTGEKKERTFFFFTFWRQRGREKGGGGGGKKKKKVGPCPTLFLASAPREKEGEKVEEKKNDVKRAGPFCKQCEGKEEEKKRGEKRGKKGMLTLKKLPGGGGKNPIFVLPK